MVFGTWTERYRPITGNQPYPAIWPGVAAAAQVDLPGGAARAQLPAITPLWGWPKRMVEQTMNTAGSAAGPMGGFVTRLRRLTRDAGVTVTLGPMLMGGWGVVAAGRAGLAFDGTSVGYYGSLGLGLGVLAGVSLTMQTSILRGNMEDIGGPAHIIQAAGPSPLAGTIGMVFDTDWTFRGISMGIGLLLGLPLQLFYELENTWLLGPGAKQKD